MISAIVPVPSNTVPITARAAMSQAIFCRILVYVIARGPVSPLSRAGSPVGPIAVYVSLLIKSKIGRYIAITMPPTTTPSSAIITGSSSVNRPATATSTSSS